MIAFSGKVHLAVGIVLGYMVIQAFKFELIYIVFAIIGSISPDIDYRHSMLGKFNPLAWLRLMKHRGITHTLLAMIVLSFILGMVNIEAGIMLGFGYFSHLLMDSFTPSGIKWLYPFK